MKISLSLYIFIEILHSCPSAIPYLDGQQVQTYNLYIDNNFY